jgi:hypothetical protein
MTSANGAQFEVVIRLDSVGLRRVYPRVREALIACGYQLTDTVPVIRVLERLVATGIERGAKRLQVRVHVSGNEVHIEVIDRRRLNPRASLPSEIVSRELARASGANPFGAGGGLVLWAIVDRSPHEDTPPAA